MKSQLGSAKRTLAAIVVASAISGCSHKAAVAQGAECAVRVIVRFAGEPTEGLLADVERANALVLDPAGTITNGLRVYSLRAAGSNNACTAAIERLRRDERVRSVDIDAQRGFHDR